MRPVFVDSSVWIDFYGKKEKPQTRCLKQLLEKNMVQLHTGDLVRLEVLQGTDKNNAATERIKAALDRLICHELAGIDRCEEAASLYALARRNSKTIRSTIDVLIARCCIENGMLLLADDKDFKSLTEVSPLKLYPL